MANKSAAAQIAARGQTNADRQERLNKALRENLLKRKQQTRSRQKDTKTNLNENNNESIATTGRLAVNGGNQLNGEITISGAKNSALPLLAAGLMTEGRQGLVLENVPELADTGLMIRLLEQLGMTVDKQADKVRIFGAATNTDAPYDLVSQMRASILVMGPLLARYGQARVALPGGCAIGSRPVDLHIRALQKLGAVVELADGYVQARTPQGLKGEKIIFPFVSVGATENVMMAACLATGTTQLMNAAREPEIIDLADCLIAMGGRISGAGTDIITIEGVDALTAASHRVIADRVEAGSYAMAVAMTGGELCLKRMNPAHLESVFDIIRQAGIDIQTGPDEVWVRSTGSYRAVDVETQPYPGFPTDLQAQFIAMMCRADGRAKISETIFENRFMHVPELVRMGADIQVDGRIALVTGKPQLLSAPVRATDLRASVSLVLAAMSAEGRTVISDIHHLDRGYARLDDKLKNCGADLERVD